MSVTNQQQTDRAPETTTKVEYAVLYPSGRVYFAPVTLATAERALRAYPHKNLHIASRTVTTTPWSRVPLDGAGEDTK